MKRFIAALSALLLAALMFAPASAAPREITWEDLIPLSEKGQGIDFGKFLEPRGLPDVSEFDGSQDELKNYVDGMEFMKQMQPQEGNEIASYLNGMEVKIAGYVTPLTFDGEEVVDFLFVPYHGACIHVPPPPANQIIYVSKAKGLTADSLYDPVWLTGKLRAQPVNTIVANVGYSIEPATVEPYTD